MSNESAKRKNTGTTLAGIAVLIPGLAISAWSLYGYLRDAGAPVWLSVGASASIDGLGLFAAAKAHSFAASGRASRFPRLITYAMVFASIYVNWSHADTAGWPMGIHVLVAVPAAAAAAGFEIIMEETRADYLEREDPRKRTRRLSKIDFVLYLRHPIEVWQLRQDEAGDALDAIMVDSPRRAARLSARRSGRRTAPVPAAPASPDTVGQTGSASVTDLSAYRPADASEADNGAADRLPAARAEVRPDARPLFSVANPDTLITGDLGIRTSDPDTADALSGSGSELAGHAASLDSVTRPTTGPEREPETAHGSITDVVRKVYRDSADTQTITRIVTELVPDAKPDTVSRAVRRVRSERADKTGRQEPGTGQYL